MLHLVMLACFAELKDVRTSTTVTHVTPATAGQQASVTTQDGSQERFDAVVLATHSNTSLQLLGDRCLEVQTNLVMVTLDS